jgi:hypothetical protein
MNEWKKVCEEIIEGAEKATPTPCSPSGRKGAGMSNDWRKVCEELIAAGENMQRRQPYYELSTAHADRLARFVLLLSAGQHFDYVARLWEESK